MPNKKSFINPAMNFISQDSIDKTEGKEAILDSYKHDPRFIEKKSKRVQLLMQPTLHQEAKDMAGELGISLNEFVHRAIQEAIEDEKFLNRIREDLGRRR